MYDGDRELLRPQFREAEDSEPLLDAYLGLGDVLVAVDDVEIVGHLQLLDDGADTLEVKNMAVREPGRGRGTGRALVDAALRLGRDRGAARMVVATAAADVGVLRFYQRLGFRMLRIERDAFGPHTGYRDNIVIDGIPLRDHVWLDQEL